MDIGFTAKVAVLSHFFQVSCFIFVNLDCTWHHSTQYCHVKHNCHLQYILAAVRGSAPTEIRVCYFASEEGSLTNGWYFN